MKAINYHIKGIVTSIEYLAKGKFLIYFLPGLILAALFFYSQIQEPEDTTEASESWFAWLSWLYVGATKFWNIIVEQVYIFLVLTALSPFFAALGEKFDKELTGYEIKGGLLRFINDFIRMIFVVIVSILMELIFMGIYWLISKVFGFPDMVNEICYYIIASFFFGFAFYDFALERHAKGLFASLGFAFSAPLGMVILGAVFQAIYLIPYVGIPIAPVLVVMISTVAYAYYTQQLPKSKQLSNE